MNPPKHSWTLIQRIQSFRRYGTFWRLRGYFERQYNLGVPIQLYKWRSLELCPSNGIHHWYVWITRRTLIALMHENWSASFKTELRFYAPCFLLSYHKYHIGERSPEFMVDTLDSEGSGICLQWFMQLYEI